VNFKKWLETRGYFPIDTIINNYRDRGFSEEEIEKTVEEIKKNYRYWCSNNGVEPTFK
jgi:hypothetical protein